MLTRLENTYLGILRVVVLVVATVALVVATLSLLYAVPSVARRLGLIPAPAANGGTLGEYVAAKKASVPVERGSAPVVNDALGTPADPDTDASAAALQRYTKGAGGMTIPRWRQELQSVEFRGVPSGHVPAYRRDVRALTDQLSHSRGKPLSLDQVRELLAWNLGKFTEYAATKDAKAAADAARATFTLYLASAAFLFFMLVVFVFLFVKVERSLRVVRTVQLETADA